MENNQHSTSGARESKASFIDEVKDFYKGEDFKSIFFTIFKNPLDGTFKIFEKPPRKAYTQSIIIFSSVFVLYFIGGYIIVGEAREYLELSDFIKIGLFPIILMFAISVVSFGLKSISGKPNFKNELLTGALCGIPIGILVPILFIVKLLANTSNIFSLLNNPEEVGVVGLLLLFYWLIFLINIFQQSLRASGTKDALAWYLSPASILASIYLAINVA